MSESRTVRTAFWLNDIVYRKLVADEEKGTILQVRFGLGGEVKYKVIWENNMYPTSHYEQELSLTYLPSYDKEEESD
jgi:hypothetical protein